MTNQRNSFSARLAQLRAAYGRPDAPLGAYATLIGAFHALLAAFLLALRWRRRPLPERVSADDLLLVGIATFKLSRLIARDIVTSVLRAPFTRFHEPAGNGEFNEQPRGRGLRRALGELLTCPFCLGQWVAAALLYGLVLAPRFTRLICSLFTALAIADVAQLGYAALQRRSQGSD
ncbi:DUF1360 domain-containing protein [Kallotenue papyrolyticum]|uniref:DUF1360 domain-containing protein n=1 Tax=Kallotenue papyrolyticum TaxID=1325125 RepID=UPI000492D5CA|nr:DUF1360 domain-containing protein [Kallotenue papyrolyticum]